MSITIQKYGRVYLLPGKKKKLNVFVERKCSVEYIWERRGEAGLVNPQPQLVSLHIVEWLRKSQFI